MRYLELLEQIDLVEGARDRYAGMLNFFDLLPQTGGIQSVRQWATGQLDWAVGTLGNADRITWFMRYIKLAAMNATYLQMAKEYESMAGWGELETNPAIVQQGQEFEVALQRLAKLMEKERKKMSMGATADVAKDLQTATTAAAASNAKLQKVRAKCETNPEGSDCGLNLEALGEKAAGLSTIAHTLANYQAQELAIPGPEDINNLVNELTHAESVRYEPMQAYRFGSKPMSVVLNTLGALESIWSGKQASTIAHREEDDMDKVLDFGDGKAWFNLHASYCNKEGAAMGHCGNDYANKETSDEVLSFRTLQGVDENGVEKWKPHLTFIFDTANGMLGEMKGRNNTKPTATYHPYIIELLKQPWVKGIVKRAHQHAKANDFYLTDLPEEQARAMAEEKPGLLTYKDRKALGMDASMDEMELSSVNEMLESNDVEIMDSMYDEDTFQLTSWNSKERAYNDLSENGFPDRYWVESITAEQMEVMGGLFDDETKKLIVMYTGLQHTEEAKEQAEFDEEEEGRQFALSDLTFDNAMQVLNDESDDIIDSILEDKWKDYHEIGLQEDALAAVDDLREYNGGEYEFDVQELDIEGQEEKGVAITMDVDYFFSDFADDLETIGRGSYGTKKWSQVLSLYVSNVNESYWGNFDENGSDSMSYFMEEAEPLLKKGLISDIKKLKEKPAYQDLAARKEFERRHGNLPLDRPEQPKEPFHTGNVPIRTDLDL